ncbi:hypothetical protein NDU88_010826 [Pleurodeles waltl]|uniref:Uncharacterized protein n=1 Tax=Pleurodeles waltl TaxID=8319 RepID=A0AAV7S286_PLEWA|nr:hypothetical protein NDU88_010826 [Pleurodeles waltl]
MWCTSEGAGAEARDGNESVTVRPAACGPLAVSCQRAPALMADGSLSQGSARQDTDAYLLLLLAAGAREPGAQERRTHRTPRRTAS